MIFNEIMFRWSYQNHAHSKWGWSSPLRHSPTDFLSFSSLSIAINFLLTHTFFPFEQKCQYRQVKSFPVNHSQLTTLIHICFAICILESNLISLFSSPQQLKLVVPTLISYKSQETKGPRILLNSFQSTYKCSVYFSFILIEGPNN